MLFALVLQANDSKCDNGDGKVCYSLSLKEDAEKSFKYLSRSCELNYALGCNKLADFHLKKSEKVKAKEFFKKSCDLNYHASCISLGEIFESEGNCDEASKIYAATYENKKYELANKKYKELLGNPKCSIINDEKEQNFLKKDQIWIGEYVCSQGQTDLTFEITDVEYNDFSAIFKFYHKKSKTEGSYSVTGNIRGNIMETRLKKWIKRPSGYYAVNILGVYDPYNKEISGQVTSKGCEYFRIKLTEEVTKKNQRDCELGEIGCIISWFCEDYIEESCTKLANIYLGMSELLDEDTRAAYINADEAIKYIQKTYYIKRNECDYRCNADIAAAYLLIAKDAQKAKNYAITSCDEETDYCHDLAKKFEKLGDSDTAKMLATSGCNRGDTRSCRLYKKNYKE